MERRRALLWTVRTSTFSLCSHSDLFALFTALPRLSDQKISMECYLILRKLHRARKIFFKIILRSCKINLLIHFFASSNDISCTREENRTTNTFFMRKLSSLDPILYIYIYFGPFNRPRRMLKGWHLFLFYPVYDKNHIKNSLY